MVSFNGRDRPNENFLLSALPFEEYQRLLPNLWPTTFSPGSVLYESGGHVDYVYFPTTSARYYTPRKTVPRPRWV